MGDSSIKSIINIQSIKGCLIVPINGEMYDDYIIYLQKVILEKVKLTHAKEVIIDISAVKFLDSFTFGMLKKTAEMLLMLGAYVVFVGFQPGVASALIDLDLDFDNLLTALTIEDGFELLEYQKSISSPDIDDSDFENFHESESDQFNSVKSEFDKSYFNHSNFTK